MIDKSEVYQRKKSEITSDTMKRIMTIVDWSKTITAEGPDPNRDSDQF